jgi:ubiquinone/menaquinone biosynthesis C-methylase UbiE
MNEQLQITNDYGRTSQMVEYWKSSRKTLADLYPSEKHFFVPTILDSSNVLDIGCAAGGSLLFCREANPKVSYTGVDVSPALVSAAQSRFSETKNSEFHLYSGDRLHFIDKTFDFVFSFGVFHHLPHWEELLAEAFRVSRKYVLIDLRLSLEQTVTSINQSYQKMAAGDLWDGFSVIHYNVISRNDLMKALTKFPCRADVFGYWRKPTDLAHTPFAEVVMASVLLTLNHPSPQVVFHGDISNW